jgi:hypothetical protein
MQEVDATQWRGGENFYEGVLGSIWLNYLLNKVTNP